MKLSRGVVRLLLLSMICISLAVRYPFTDHEIGVDSFFVHNLATNIAKDGYAEWVVNPLSLFGWYPMSYPSGSPFLVSSSASLFGLPIEATILLLSIGFGSLAVLTSFVMAREFRDDDVFCILVSFLYSLAPRLLDFTLWTASARGLFVVILPIFVWSTLRAAREPGARSIALVLGLFLVLASIHRMAALLVAIMGALVGALMVGVSSHIIRITFPRQILGRAFRRVSGLLGLIGLTGFAASVLLGTSILRGYSQGELVTGDSIEVELFNLGVSITRSVGLAVALAMVGFLVLVRTRNKTLRESYVLLVFLALLPTLFLRQYTGFYILPFIAILGGLGLAGLLGPRRRAVRRAVGAGCLVLVLASSTGILSYEIDHSTTIPDATYSTAIYIEKEAGSDRIIANDGLLAVRIASTTASPVLPIGGAATTSQGPELLAYRYYAYGEISQDVSRVPLGDLTLDSDSPWVVYGVDAQVDWVKIMQSPYDQSSPALVRYHPDLYVENRAVPLLLYAFDHTSPSAFAESAHADAYLVFQSIQESVYFVSSP